MRFRVEFLVDIECTGGVFIIESMGDSVNKDI